MLVLREKSQFCLQTHSLASTVTMPLNTKQVLKDYCKYVYFAGAGNCWFQNIYQESLFYKLYSIVSFTIYTIMILLENFVVLFKSFPEAEQNSATMFAAIHDIVLTKMFLLLYHKKSIKTLNKEMGSVGESFEEESVMKEQHRKIKVGIFLYVVSVYLSLIAYGVESMRKMIEEDAPFYTVVTYYPAYDDNSIMASTVRVFFYITWLYMMLPMMSADCFPITHVIAMRYKFVTLINHYERIRDHFEQEVKEKRSDAVKRLKAGFLEGIVMHQKLIVLADEIHRVFGVIMSLQVCESSAVAVLLLLRLALSPHMNLTNALMTYTFVGSLFLLLALNLWNAGDMTYQASLLSNAMFNCGWHRSKVQQPAHQDIRRLVIIGCAQANKPLILKAFGIQDLSYETFVSVAKMTYSVFAVFYKRGQ